MNSNPTNIAIVVAVIGVLGTLGAAIINNWDSLFPTPTITSVPQPIETAEPPTNTSTPSIDSTSSCPTSTSSRVYVEDFTKELMYWQTVSIDDERRTTSTSVRNGAFRWQETAKKGISTGIWSTLPNLSDFDLEITLRLIDGSDDFDYGVRFRGGSSGSYYFHINRVGEYRLYKWVEQDQAYHDIIEWEKTNAINLNGENKLAIRAEGNNIRLCINDTVVDNAVDSSFTAGDIALHASLNTGERLTLDMTSFKVIVY